MLSSFNSFLQFALKHKGKLLKLGFFKTGQYVFVIQDVFVFNMSLLVKCCGLFSIKTIFLLFKLMSHILSLFQIEHFWN